MRLIVNALIITGIALFAWLIALLSFCVLYARHSPGPKTLAMFAMAPVSLVTMLIIAIYRLYSRRIWEN
jgi:hypothetical protein